MKKQYITDLRVGVPVDSLFVVARKEVKKKKNGEDFCSVTLQDKAGKIEGVIWTDVFKDIDNFSEGDFVLVKGDISEYKGGKQLIINSIARIEDEKEIEYSDFIRTTKKDVGKMMSELKSFIVSIKNYYLRELLGIFFNDRDFTDDFCTATAAVQYHHAYRGGLLEHTLFMTKICDFLAGLYENLNRDLLITGAILHDVGKVKEYKTEIITKVTDEGKLLGHITIGYGWVLENIQKIKDFPEDLRNRLLHIILSHHGYKEFGSPKRPKILEAFVIYHVDHMDADIGGYNILLEESSGEEAWSAFAKNFDGSVMLRRLKIEDDVQEYNGFVEEINSMLGGKMNNNKKDREHKREGELGIQDELF